MAVGALIVAMNVIPAIAATSRTRCLLRAQTLDLCADHLLQRFRNLQSDLARRTPKPPAAGLVLDQTGIQQMLQHGDHEQRVAFSVAMQHEM